MTSKQKDMVLGKSYRCRMEWKVTRTVNKWVNGTLR